MGASYQRSSGNRDSCRADLREERAACQAAGGVFIVGFVFTMHNDLQLKGELRNRINDMFAQGVPLTHLANRLGERPRHRFFPSSLGLQNEFYNFASSAPARKTARYEVTDSR